MNKSIWLIKRKSGISREEFAKHYEEVHIPLVSQYGSFKKHVRNLVIPSGSEETEFDCITEVWFEDMAAYLEGMKFYQSTPDNPIRQDEDTFMDRSKLFHFIVQEIVLE